MELLRAKKKLEALKKEHQKLSSQVQKHSIFKNYLEDVVKISPQFEDIQDVISRYKLLVRTRKDLQQSQEKDREMMEQAKVLLDQYEAEKAAEILQCRNELEQLQRRFAQAQSDVRFWTARWADIQNRNAKNALMLTTMKMAVHNLFQCVNTQLKAKVHVPEDDSLRQLDMVEPSQTPPCPERGAVMTLSCPKGGESPEKSRCPTDTSLSPWAVSWAWGMGGGHQANLSRPRRQSRGWMPVGSWAGWGRGCRSTHGYSLASFTPLSHL
ncbi:coiled-coil domain-containing protein 42-like isoform X1 [Patagioenas fasciata]|uniref:coiled-coil domain-containing protein 42-like isoform X1 n=1 Tax=Patagioenas fasciata TaxID=372321 RepID=UPI003A98EABC